MVPFKGQCKHSIQSETFTLSMYNSS